MSVAIEGKFRRLAIALLAVPLCQTAPAAPPKPADRDLCIAYDSRDINVVAKEADFLVTSGPVQLHRFKKREQAEAAALVARHYDHQCFLETTSVSDADKPSIMSPDFTSYSGLREYWRGKGVGGDWPKDDDYCFDYDKATAHLANRSNNYQIDVGAADDYNTIAVTSSKPAAQRLLAMARQQRLCRINPLGLPGDSLQYFR